MVTVASAIRCSDEVFRTLLPLVWSEAIKIPPRLAQTLLFWDINSFALGSVVSFSPSPTNLSTCPIGNKHIAPPPVRPI